jgi:hypothetical protein
MPFEMECVESLRGERPQHGHIYPSTTHYSEGPISEPERRVMLTQLSREPALVDPGPVINIAK